MGQLVFLSRICTHCAGYGSAWCSSGYGNASARLFKKRSREDFQQAFNRYIASVFPQFFIPPAVGVYHLMKGFDPLLLTSLLVFIAVAFVWIPYRSRTRGCGSCPQKTDCAWSGHAKR